jgi:hypothetical protein
MAKFNSIEEAQKAMHSSNEEINSILNEDLYPIEESKRTVDLWMSTYGSDPRSLETKQKLSALEMTATDAEIYCIYSAQVESSKDMRKLSDTFA